MKGTIILQNITAYSNHANQEYGAGGFSHFDLPEDGALVIRRSAFWYNTASKGGAVYANKDSIVALSGVAGWRNSATVGGFLYCEACTMLGT
jgi:predicted outer membrane repeat protein